jgi:hypothetical protein
VAHYNFIYSFIKNITSINSLGESVILFKIKEMELVEAPKAEARISKKGQNNVVLEYSMNYCIQVGSLKQVNIQNAFMHEYLKEHAYVWQPFGFAHPNFLDHVCLLRKERTKYSLLKTQDKLSREPFKKCKKMTSHTSLY